MRAAFPKLFSVGSVDIPNFFKSELADNLTGEFEDRYYVIEVTEKIDGSQFSFGKENGEVQCRSKGKEQDINNPDKMFAQGAAYALSIADRLPEGAWFYCEYLQKPKHSTLAYDNIPKNHLALFGASFLQDGVITYVDDYVELEEIAESLEIDVVPLVYKGIITSPEQIRDLLNKTSYLGGQKIEGVVLKRYEPWLYGSQPLPLMGQKFVSEAFKEVHRETWKSDNTNRGRWDKFKEGFKTSARWDKAILHLEESGQLEHTPRDIPKVIAEIKRDIADEEKQNIVNFLWDEYGKDLLAFSAHGAAEHYKQWLLDQAFDNQTAKLEEV